MSTHISLSTVAYDNEPYIRSLTAVVMDVETSTPLTINDVAWDYPNNTVSVTNFAGITYAGGLSAANEFGKLIFNFSGNTYNDVVSSYDLFTYLIKTSSVNTGVVISTAELSTTYDSFPDIQDLALYINNEFTTDKSFFYRLTSEDVYSASINFLSDSFDFTYIDSPELSANYFQVYYTVNNDTTSKYTSVTAITSFDTALPIVSSVELSLSALSATNSFSAWYSPHTLERTISAVFVTEFLSAADFIAYPNTYFISVSTQGNNTSNVLTYTPGLSFYGEGHTQKIYLSAVPGTAAEKYVWKFGNFTNIYTNTVSGANPQFSTAAVSISTDIGDYPTIPITLQATNSVFPSSSPLFYFDDTTGEQLYYPYINSTVYVSGGEIPSIDHTKESIHVLPYTEVSFIFNPGAPDVVYLPANGFTNSYTASLEIGSKPGSDALKDCYQKYELLWKWSTFVDCSATSNFTDMPSSWATTQCTISAGTGGMLTSATNLSVYDGNPSILDSSATYAKKWGYQPPGDIDTRNINPIACSAGSVTWNLSTINWSVTYIDNTGLAKSIYPYNLQLSGYGTLPFTTSIYEPPTLITLKAAQSVSCIISATPYDWKRKNSTFDNTNI